MLFHNPSNSEAATDPGKKPQFMFEVHKIALALIIAAVMSTMKEYNPVMANYSRMSCVYAMKLANIGHEVCRWDQLGG